MSCSACLYVIGENYSLSGGSCSICGYYPKHSYTGTYLGKSGDKHTFRLHHEVCPSCGFRMNRGVLSCSSPDGIDVTEEFRLLVYR